MTTPAVGEWGPDDDPVDEPIETIGADLDLEAAVDEAPPPRFATLPEFVDEFLLEICWTDVDVASKTWCPEWWKHPAAIVRLEALHRSFEHLRLDPGTGMSSWLRDHADYHMPVLTDPNGIFKGCARGKGHDAERVRVIDSDTPPPGLFDVED